MPIREIVYLQSELTKGVCMSCGEKSHEILKDEGRCIDCIEEQAFYDETMKDL